MIETLVLDSVEAVEPGRWNALFPGELEDWSYLRAIERSRLPGFRFVYLVVREGARLLAAVPAFLTDYRLDTTVSGALKHVTEAAAKLLPRLLRIPMLALGSPVTEHCRVGFDPAASERERTQWVDALLAGMEALAAREHAQMLAVKDAADSEAAWARVLPRHGLRAMPGLPCATLDLRFDDLDGYLASLGSATRKDLRRKWRAASGLRIEWRGDLDGIRDEVMRLYRATLAHAEFQFEELNAAYFENVLREMPGRAFCVTYREGEALLAFNLVLQDSTRLLDKFFGADPQARLRYNLYRVSWLENVRHCIARRIPAYESGQGLPREKARLGSRMQGNTLWYRHRNRFVDGVFARVDRLARVDRNRGKAQCA